MFEVIKITVLVKFRAAAAGLASAGWEKGLGMIGLGLAHAASRRTCCTA
jgi:hypothetical protein